MSEVEMIGTALFGQSWMAQIASVLKNEAGEPLSRQTVQTWHNRDRLPHWAKDELKDIAQIRFNEIKQLNVLLGNLPAPAVDNAIDKFLSWNHPSITPESVIYCRLRFGNDKYGNDLYEADVTLEPQTGEGWQKLRFSAKHFAREMRDIRKDLKSKLQPHMAVHDSNIDKC